MAAGFLYLRTDTRPTRTLERGDLVRLPPRRARPAPTPGQIGFLDTRDRSLICGDVHVALGGLFVTTTVAWRFPPSVLGTGTVRRPGGRPRPYRPRV